MKKFLLNYFSGYGAVAKLCVAVILLASQNVANAQIQEEFLVGYTSWTVPAGVFSVTVECWGAGGGGGRATSAGQTTGGGGGGAYASSTISVTPGQVITYAIGAGGAGNSTGSGNPGGDTWFLSTATVLAKGGNGVAQNSTAAGAGGSAAASVGTTKYSGGNGVQAEAMVVVEVPVVVVVAQGQLAQEMPVVMDPPQADFA